MARRSVTKPVFLSVLLIMGMGLTGCSYEHHKNRDPNMELATPSLMKQDQKKNNVSSTSSPMTRDQGMTMTRSPWQTTTVGPDAMIIQAPESNGVMQKQMPDRSNRAPVLTIINDEPVPQTYTPVIDNSYPRPAR